MIAKDEYSLMHLSDQFRARSVQRTYQSITLGCPSPPQGQVSTNIGRDSSDRKKMAAFAIGSSRHAFYHLSFVAYLFVSVHQFLVFMHHSVCLFTGMC